MLREATKNNNQYIIMDRVSLQKGDCEKLRFANESFDRVCSVNTIYFWRPPDVE